MLKKICSFNKAFIVLASLLSVLIVGLACGGEVPTPIVIEKIVVKEVIKEVMVTPEPRGPTPIVRSLRWRGVPPVTYSEHPNLTKLANAGRLPLLQERLPRVPLVMIGPEGIGKYGDKIRDLHAKGDFRNCCLLHDGLVDIATDGSVVEPHLAEKWEMEDGFRKLIFTLREGMKWSDGKPFTSSDYQFGFETTVANKELMPNPPSWNYGAFDELPEMVVKDDRIFSYTFTKPYPGLLRAVLTNWRGSGSYNPQETGDALAYIPKHYMEQFTKGSVPDDELNKRVNDGGYSDWTQMFRQELKWFFHPDGQVPVTGPWMNISGSPNGEVWRMKANPYFYEVDSDGNQLPYIYEWVSEMATDSEVLNLKLVAGESNFQYRYVDPRKLTLFMLNTIRQGYRVQFVPSTRVDAKVVFNLTHDDDSEIGDLLRTFDFRRAVSAAIDRDRINTVVFNQLGETGGMAPPKLSPYYLGPDYDKKNGQYDPELAKKLLDDLGFKKDAYGFYMRSDGKGRLQPTLWTYPAGDSPTGASDNATAELVVEDLNDIGLNAILKQAVWPDPYNLLQMQMDSGDTDPMNGAYTGGGVEVGNWFSTKGAEGADPNTVYGGLLKPLVEIHQRYEKIRGTNDREEQLAVAKELIILSVDNLYEVGIIKGSPAGKGNMIIVQKDLRNVLAQPRSGGLFHHELYFFDTSTGNID